jgi:hypothetical protein
LAEVNAWWEWFLTTITDAGPTELIAVKNRSHKILKLLSDSKKVSFSIKLVALPYKLRRPAAVLTTNKRPQTKSGQA